MEGKFQGKGAVCFAPPITDRQLESEWPALISRTSGLLRNSLEQLHRLCSVHRKHEPSQKKAHLSTIVDCGDKRSKIIHHVSLEDHVKSELHPHVPSAEEREIMSNLFDKIDPTSQKDLRDMAFHLLWYANELSNGREPLTNDKLS